MLTLRLQFGRLFVRFLSVLFLSTPVALAGFRIEVTSGVDNALRVAVVPFAYRGASGLSVEIHPMIDSDLTLSGRFDTLPTAQMLSLPHKASEVFPRDWRLLNVEYLVMGSLEQSTLGFRLHYELYDVFKQAVIVAESITGTYEDMRDMAHHVSDLVYEQLTGIAGAFSTQIMYVTVDGRIDEPTYYLNIADADGHRAETILTSKEPILSATWAPDGRRIAYVSFEHESRPAIYMRDMISAQTQQLTSFPGLNGAPTFSPDGTELAMVLSKDGNPDIYVLNLETHHLRRITRHYSIDTEPSWRPDGQAIAFTSNRGGKPQIYQASLLDLKIERLTYEGNYNAKASWLPDGSGLIMVHRRERVFHIALLDLQRGTLKVLTATTLDESPSIAPNGSAIIYATQKQAKGILAVASIDGGVKFDLPSSKGDVREPAWSPHKRKTFLPIQ